jgi:sirohydrochlorin ferrochelatase
MSQFSSPAMPSPVANRLFGVSLLGHGSRRGRCTDEGLREASRRLAERLSGVAVVREAFFEFLEPTLEDSLAYFQNRGLRRVVVMPYFLFDGKEIKRDIPHLLSALRPRFPGLDVTLASNLGVDDRLISLVTERVAGALHGLGQLLPIGGRLPIRGESGPVGVILVNRGSRPQYDNGGRLRELCDRLSQALEDVPVEPAQAERSPILTIANAAQRLIEARCERIVVVPYLHFPGKVLFVNVIPVVNQLAESYPEARFYLASTLCVDDRLIDICVDRIRQAISPASRSVDE